MSGFLGVYIVSTVSWSRAMLLYIVYCSFLTAIHVLKLLAGCWWVVANKQSINYIYFSTSFAMSKISSFPYGSNSSGSQNNVLVTCQEEDNVLLCTYRYCYPTKCSLGSIPLTLTYYSCTKKNWFKFTTNIKPDLWLEACNGKKC